MEFAELAFRRLEGSVQTADYVHWAVTQLEGGCTSSCVAELASLTLDAELDTRQIESLFQRCALELGLNHRLKQDWYEALLAFTSHICDEMISGTIAPDVGLAQLLSIAEDNHDPYMLTIWLDLVTDISEAMHPQLPGHLFFNRALDLTNTDECVRTTAAQYAALCSTKVPDCFPRVWWCLECGCACEPAIRNTGPTERCPSCCTISSLRNMRYYENRERVLLNGLTALAASAANISNNAPAI